MTTTHLKRIPLILLVLVLVAIFAPPFFGISLLNKEEVITNKLRRSECPAQQLETATKNIVAISTCTRFNGNAHLVLLIEVQGAPDGSVLHTEAFSSLMVTSPLTAECVLHTFTWKILATDEVLEGDITFDIVPSGWAITPSRFQVSTYMAFKDAVYRTYPCGRRMAPAHFYCHIKITPLVKDERCDNYFFTGNNNGITSLILRFLQSSFLQPMRDQG